MLAMARCCSMPMGEFNAILYLHMYSIPKNASGIMIALTTHQPGMLSDGGCKTRSLFGSVRWKIFSTSPRMMVLEATL